MSRSPYLCSCLARAKSTEATNSSISRIFGLILVLTHLSRRGSRIRRSSRSRSKRSIRRHSLICCKVVHDLRHCRPQAAGQVSQLVAQDDQLLEGHLDLEQGVVGGSSSSSTCRGFKNPFSICHSLIQVCLAELVVSAWCWAWGAGRSRSRSRSLAHL